MGEVTVDDAAIFIAQLSGGGLATFEATRFATGRKNAIRIEINGSEGSVAFDFEDMNILHFFDNNDDRRDRRLPADPRHRAGAPYVKAWWPAGHLIGYEHGFTHQVVDLVEDIAARPRPAAVVRRRAPSPTHSRRRREERRQHEHLDGDPRMSDRWTPVPEDKLSFGLWTVGWRGVDVFGGAVRDELDPVEAVERLAGLGAAGDHLPRRRSRARRRDPRARRWSASRKALAENDVAVDMATTNLFSSPVFKDGGFTSNDREVRRYALAKAARNIDLGARWAPRRTCCGVAATGAESGAAKDIHAALDRLREALDLLCAYVREQGYDIRFALEPKPNEPRGDILLPTIGHALAFINELDEPALVGLNPEVGHEEMAGLNYAHGIAQALWHGKLFHIDLNGQHGPRFDQDLRFGAGNVRGAFWAVDVLEGSVAGRRGTTASSTSTTSRRGPRMPTTCGRQPARTCATT